MSMCKKDVEKRWKSVKAEVDVLEAKCAGGSGTKEDYISLAKLKKKLK